jgi:hypothetical protein
MVVGVLEWIIIRRSVPEGKKKRRKEKEGGPRLMRILHRPAAKWFCFVVVDV